MSVHSVTIFSTTMPKPIVTMARLGPETRTDGIAMTRPKTAPKPQAKSSDSQGERPHSILAIAAV